MSPLVLERIGSAPHVMLQVSELCSVTSLEHWTNTKVRVLGRIVCLRDSGPLKNGATGKTLHRTEQTLDPKDDFGEPKDMITKINGSIKNGATVKTLHDTEQNIKHSYEFGEAKNTNINDLRDQDSPRGHKCLRTGVYEGSPTQMFGVRERVASVKEVGDVVRDSCFRVGFSGTSKSDVGPPFKTDVPQEAATWSDTFLLADVDALPSTCELIKGNTRYQGCSQATETALVKVKALGLDRCVAVREDNSDCCALKRHGERMDTSSLLWSDEELGNDFNTQEFKDKMNLCRNNSFGKLVCPEGSGAPCVEDNAREGTSAAKIIEDESSGHVPAVSGHAPAVSGHAPAVSGWDNTSFFAEIDKLGNVTTCIGASNTTSGNKSNRDSDMFADCDADVISDLAKQSPTSAARCEGETKDLAMEHSVSTHLAGHKAFPHPEPNTAIHHKVHSRTERVNDRSMWDDSAFYEDVDRVAVPSGTSDRPSSAVDCSTGGPPQGAAVSTQGWSNKPYETSPAGTGVPARGDEEACMATLYSVGEAGGPYSVKVDLRCMGLEGTEPAWNQSRVTVFGELEMVNLQPVVVAKIVQESSNVSAKHYHDVLEMLRQQFPRLVL